MKKLLRHPLAVKARRAVKIAVVIVAVIIAVAAVTTVTVDLGPALRERAERQGSAFIERPMRIGRLSVRLWDGRFRVEDLVIDGLGPESRPFLTAKRIDVSMPWETLFNQRIVLDAIEMTGWNMYLESFPNGRHNLPRLTRQGAPGRSNWTTTVQYVRAHQGELTFRDHGADWSTVARNLEVVVARPSDEYRGTAKFSNGTIAIQSHVPMRADMRSIFKIEGGQVLFDRIDLVTDGATSVLTGQVDLTRWPEQLYHVKSRVHFPRMREIFFSRDRFSLHGEGDFTGTFHLFRGGRELKGTFYCELAGVNAYRFHDLQGSLVWLPDRFAVTEASAGFSGGQSGFTFAMAPLGRPGVRRIATFDAEYRDVDLLAFTDFLELQGLRLAGRATGRNLLEWPLGRFAERRGEGTMTVAAPGEVRLLTRAIPVQEIEADAQRGEHWGPFSNHLPIAPVPIGGEVTYAFGPEWIDIAPSRVATPETYIEFEGRTAYGDRSTIPFHVTSADWQESDRLLAGVLTAFGSPMRVIAVGGYGTFDGLMTGAMRRSRIEGTFAGERMTAWDVVWGSARGTAVIENNYADVTGVVITSGTSTIRADGRFSLGYPRRDGGEEINARVRISGRPLADLRHAFRLDDYPVEGLLSGEYHVYGKYQTPHGFGSMTIADGVAYGEPFELATAALRFEGAGVRLDNIEVQKGSGRGTGAAYVGWDGTYAFNFTGRRIPVESLAAAKASTAPLSGLIEVTAGGSGTFDAPRYDVRGSIVDFFAGDEGIGQVAADLSVRGDVLTITLEAASPRLAVSGAGRIALTEEMDAELSFRVSDTSLDPYVRAFNPRLSPFTTAVASGSLRVVGELANIDHLLVDATVDSLDVRLFDYRLQNASPIRVALDRHSVRVSDMRLVGEDTELDVTGVVSLHDERIAMRATGVANLGILQGFASDVRSSGRATVKAAFEGPMRNPAVTGTLRVEDGRIRHFDLPHALESINGTVGLDARGLQLDGLRGRLGGGDVQFGGRIGIEGYRPGRLDVTMTGRDMRLRFPAGMRSVVDADLSLRGTMEQPMLGGTVLVRSAIYTRRFDAGGGLFDLAGGASSQTSTLLQPTLPLRYDVRIHAPSTLRIENNTARVVASADLQLRGTFDRPLLVGRADIERGEVLFEGKRYVVTRGTIDFNNPARIEPFIDVEAETRVRVPGQTYQVTVRALGTFERLSTELTSDPPLSEVEVLGLLFADLDPGQLPEGRGYSETVTPQQQLLQERAARALTGTLSSEVGRVVEQTFGVDTFQLTPSVTDVYQQSSRFDPGARLTIGKRLSDRVYLTYSRSLSSTTRDQIILLEYDQTDRLSWILSRNEDRTYALDVRVRHVF
ncbi:MAG: translocation/assembly module TamB domain-containing protein [Vicinamibacterales bacterium]